MAFKETIIKDYNEICEIMKDVKTVEDARTMQDKLSTIIEIGVYGDCGYPCKGKRFDEVKPSDIEWFRVEDYHTLSYIYFYTNGSVVFNVCKDDDDYWLDSVTIDTVRNMEINCRSVKNDSRFKGFGYEVQTIKNL